MTKSQLMRRMHQLRRGAVFQIRETFVDCTKDVRFGEGPWVDVEHRTRGELYADLQSEYGRCISHMYREVDGRDGVPVGWVFEKWMEYEDARPDWPPARRRYKREVWVEVRQVEKVEEPA